MRFLQTKMDGIQILFDMYKIVSIELHRKTKSFTLSSAEFFNRCPSCTNRHLVKGEYQAIVNSIRERLPLKGVVFEHDSTQYETLTRSSQIKFIEELHLQQEEEKLSKQSELNRYGMSLDLMPKSIRKYQGQISWADKERQRSANNVLNNKTYKLSHMLQETAVLDELVV